MSKILDSGQVKEVFIRRMEGESLREIAVGMKISRQYAMNILNREAYKDVEIPERLISIARHHVPLKRAKAIKRTTMIKSLYEQGFAQVEIAKKLGCGTATVCRTLKDYK